MKILKVVVFSACVCACCLSIALLGNAFWQHRRHQPVDILRATIDTQSAVIAYQDKVIKRQFEAVDKAHAMLRELSPVCVPSDNFQISFPSITPPGEGAYITLQDADTVGIRISDNIFEPGNQFPEAWYHH